MSRAAIERKLIQIGQELRSLRDELAVADEQLAHFAGIAEETRLRSMVSETPTADREHRDAQRHADAMAAHRAEVAAEIARLETAQDELLDRFTAGSG